MTRDRSVIRTVLWWVWSLVREVIERLVGIDIGHTEGSDEEKGNPRPKHSQSLLRVLLIGILLLVFPAVGLSGWQIVKDFLRKKEVHKMQDDVKSMESALAKLETIQQNRNSNDKFELVYQDKTSGEKVAVDLWIDGRLAYRKFYRNQRLIARDTFSYEGKQPSGKTREYLQRNVVVLVDEFTQGGELKSKRYYENGQEGNCRKYLREFRSPLPPSAIVFYR